MKLFETSVLISVLIMPFADAKNSELQQENQPVKINENIFKEARELPYFRLPWMEEKYDRWSQSKVARTALTKQQLKALPSRVDNSENKAWQGIGDQGRTNSCSQEGTVAGMLSYEINAYRNRDGRKAENSLPSHFSWNFFNKAKNGGAEMIHGLETAYTIGIPSQKLYGGRYNDLVGHWPNGYGIWHDAMKNRIAAYDFVKVTTPEKLQFAKAWIHNHAGWFKSRGGGMLTIDATGLGDEKIKQIPKRSHEAGKHIWTDWGSKYGGHVMCVVGYDDEVGYDVNNDGKITNDLDINNDGEVTIADYERGAFIVANSWGKNWADEGKVYVLYRCLMSRSSFWDRGPFMAYAVPSNRQPRATIRFKALHNKRDNIQLGLSLIDRNNNKRYEMNTHAMFQNSGAVPLGGPGEENKDFEWGIDLTRLVEQSGNNFEQVLKDLQVGKAKLEIHFTERKKDADKKPKKKKNKKKKDKKRSPPIEVKGQLKEVELMFWNKSGTMLGKKNLLFKEKTLTESVEISYPN
ncbi:hypothetical protein LNTAR_09741 [Lentisphaera araneosa HTCC2155]|uniref:Peptidase C1A papain C-terminal domain-containing protein n=1 Tax=Lentisphaera araneosa HTCC2155 TaxID=313628 RepID=A6DSG1_9BACT|nr:hypothetical protein [Lentisphaera araneosa]EDM25406.1 hypothetical protein LNTAR_09741 [Lentisphaera araneosa HTCC2155]